MNIRLNNNNIIIENIDKDNFYLFINKEVNSTVHVVDNNIYGITYYPTVNKDTVGAIAAEKIGSDCRLYYIKFNPIDKDNFIVEEIKDISILTSIMIPNKQIVYNGSYYELHNLVGLYL